MILLIMKCWVPLFGWMGLIFYLSHIPSLTTGLGMWDLILRKCAHVVEYAVLAYLFIRTLHFSWPLVSSRKIIVLSFILSVLYAASDELHQRFVPGRGPSVVDVVIDAVGAGWAALLIAKGIIKIK